MCFDDLIKLENKRFNALQEDDFDKFEELLKDRESLCRGFANESPDQFKNYLASEAFRDCTEKINELYNIKKESIGNDMKKLALSRKAEGEYISNSSYNPQRQKEIYFDP